jgi:hypothetical protein
VDPEEPAAAPAARRREPVQDDLPELPLATGARDEFVSPFEDELDVPTFLRRSRHAGDEEEDRELPAFLRRSAD